MSLVLPLDLPQFAGDFGVEGDANTLEQNSFRCHTGGTNNRPVAFIYLPPGLNYVYPVSVRPESTRQLAYS